MSIQVSLLPQHFSCDVTVGSTLSAACYLGIPEDTSKLPLSGGFLSGPLFLDPTPIEILTRTYSPGDPGWRNIKCSLNGTYVLMFSQYENRIFMSSDGGQSFASLPLTESNLTFREMAMSDDGRVAAVIFEGYNSIYLTKDWGSSWEPINNPNYYISVDVSSDGNYLIAISDSYVVLYDLITQGSSAINTGYLNKVRFGKNYSDPNGPDDLYFLQGPNIFKTSLALGPWNFVSTPDVGNFTISWDGNVFAAWSPYGEVKISINGGSTWQTILPVNYWKDVNLSLNGQYVVAVTENGYTYFSKDFGNNWLTLGPTNDWKSCCISSNGKKVFLLADAGFNNSSEGLFIIESVYPTGLLTNSISASTYLNLPQASNTTYGVVKVDNNTVCIVNGCLVGTPSFNLPTATSTVLGGVKVGTSLNISNGVLDSQIASSSQLGAVRVGPSLCISNSCLDSRVASTTQLGAVKVGTSLCINNSILDSQIASSSQLGAVRVGPSLCINNSCLDSRVASASQLGAVKVGTSLCINNSILDSQIASPTQLGAVKVGNFLSIDGSGFLSVASSPLSAYTSLPNMDNIACAGTSTCFSRGDHTHPSDTKKLSISGGSISGTLAASAASFSSPITGSFAYFSGTLTAARIIGDLGAATFPVASTVVPGVVRVDGTSILINNGVISGAPTYTLACASSTVLGGIKIPTSPTYLSVTNGVLGISNATSSLPGLMSTTDKSKLDGIAFSSTAPLMDGAASVGSSANYARADHVHPSDTSRLSLAGGTLTGHLQGTSAGFSGSVISGSMITAPVLNASNCLQVTNGITAGSFNGNGSGLTNVGVVANCITLLGCQAGSGSGGCHNTFIGSKTGQSATGICNTFTGSGNGSGGVSGCRNTATGAGILRSLTSGNGNISIGVDNSPNLSTGSDNITIGNAASYSVTTGSNNIALGSNSLSVNIGSSNIGIGNYSMASKGVGDCNVVVGIRGLNSLTSGTGNTAIGHQAGCAITGGNNNIYIGHSWSGSHPFNTSAPCDSVIIGTNGKAYLCINCNSSISTAGSLTVNNYIASNTFTTNGLTVNGNSCVTGTGNFNSICSNGSIRTAGLVSTGSVIACYNVTANNCISSKDNIETLKKVIGDFSTGVGSVRSYPGKLIGKPQRVTYSPSLPNFYVVSDYDSTTNRSFLRLVGGPNSTAPGSITSMERYMNEFTGASSTAVRGLFGRPKGFSYTIKKLITPRRRTISTTGAVYPFDLSFSEIQGVSSSLNKIVNAYSPFVPGGSNVKSNMAGNFQKGAVPVQTTTINLLDGDLAFFGTSDFAAGYVDGSITVAKFNNPSDFVRSNYYFTPANTYVLYVADTGNNCIRKITWGTATASVSTLVGSPARLNNNDGISSVASIVAPKVICMSPSSGYIYAWSDYTGGQNVNAIRRIDSQTGEVFPSYFPTFTDVRAMACSDVYLYVLAGNAIYVVDPSTGSIAFTVGAQSTPGNVSGYYTDVRFNNPTDLMIDGDYVIITDSDNFDIKYLYIPTMTVRSLIVSDNYKPQAMNSISNSTSSVSFAVDSFTYLPGPIIAGSLITDSVHSCYASVCRGYTEYGSSSVFSTNSLTTNYLVNGGDAYFCTNTCTYGNIYANGDVVAFASSDCRLKQNIVNIPDSLSKVLALNGVTFDWCENVSSYNGADVGVLAQEVEKVMPEIVSTRTNGYKAVRYEKLVPLLIEAIKELKFEIDSIKNK